MFVIVLQRIFPPNQSSDLVRRGAVVHAATVSEFGVYSVLLTDASGEVVMNKAAGHLLRTKVGFLIVFSFLRLG